MNAITKAGVLVLASTLLVRASDEPQATENHSEKTWTGTLTAVSDQDKILSAKGWLLSKTFNIGQNCTVSTINKSQAALSDLQPGEKVEVRFRSAGGVLVADRITEQPLRYSGTVQAVDPKAETLTLEQGVRKTGPFRQPLRIANDCKVVLSNGKDGTINDVKPGDQVTIIYQLPGGSPLAHHILEKTTTFVGKLEAIDLPARTVKAKEIVGQKKLTLADGCQILVPGKEDAQLKDLELGQKYKFTYESVNGVNVAVRIAF